MEKHWKKRLNFVVKTELSFMLLIPVLKKKFLTGLHKAVRFMQMFSLTTAIWVDSPVGVKLYKSSISELNFRLVSMEKLKKEKRKKEDFLDYDSFKNQGRIRVDV